MNEGKPMLATAADQYHCGACQKDIKKGSPYYRQKVERKRDRFITRKLCVECGERDLSR